jgi:hypothetical protein
MDIVLGRHARLPEGVETGKNLLLMGDCSGTLKQRIEKAGETCLHVAGCPPGEPLPCWMIVDRGDPQFSDLADVRRRQVAEEAIFTAWLEDQRANQVRE